MCLRTITKRVEKPSKRITKAWKIFEVDSERKLSFPYRWSEVKINIWLKATEKELLTEQNPKETYISGFHCYKNKKDAEEWFEIQGYSDAVILEVKIKEITYHGKQWATKMYDCFVAKQMFILKQEEVPTKRST